VTEAGARGNRGDESVYPFEASTRPCYEWDILHDAAVDGGFNEVIPKTISVHMAHE
jgi:hypothetical protein